MLDAVVRVSVKLLVRATVALLLRSGHVKELRNALAILRRGQQAHAWPCLVALVEGLLHLVILIFLQQYNAQDDVSSAASGRGDKASGAGRTG